MFGAAVRLGQQAALSELMRDQGMRVAVASEHQGAEFFLNSDPCEVGNQRFIDSLTRLRSDFPTLAMVVEVHEAAVVVPSKIVELRSILNDLDMKLAYDDFGAGQGRLLELGEVPPDVLKFDMQLIRGIDQAAAPRQEMIATLVKLANDLGSTSLAEGVETVEEHETCVQLGFQLGQGFLNGRPERF